MARERAKCRGIDGHISQGKLVAKKKKDGQLLTG